MSAMIFLYVMMGTFAGYHSARLYRTMRGKEWKKQAFMVRPCETEKKHISQITSEIFIFVVFADGHIVPRNSIQHLLRSKLFHLGQSFLGSCPIWYHALASCPLVWNIFTSGISWSVLWIQETLSASSPHQSDSTASATAALVHETTPEVIKSQAKLMNIDRIDCRF